MSFLSDFEAKFYRIQFGGKQRLRTYRKLSRYLKNGVPLTTALESIWMHASSDGKKPKDPTAMAVDEWRRRVANGKSLGKAVAGWVPENDRIVLDAGEGDLPGALDNACLLHESQSAIRGALAAGLGYPVFLMAISVVFLAIFGLKVVPQLDENLSKDKWTGLGYLLGVMATFVQTLLVPSLIAFALITVAMLWSMPKLTGSLRVKLDRYPPYSIYRLVAGSGFLLSMAALIKAGVKTTVALRLLQKDAKPWYSERISRTLAFVNDGQSLGDALLKTKLEFPDRETVNDLRAYSTLDGFEDMLMKIGTENLSEAVKSIKAQTDVLRNVGIVVMGGLFAFFYLGIFSVLQQITNSL